ncbi:beta-lactamase family protein [Maribacter sp.]|nr:beta-lactamase family protein [Maribacter sp.]
MRYLLLCISICFLCTGCSATKAISYDSTPSIELQRILDEEGANPKSGIAGISLSVMSPELGIDFTGATGYDSTEKNRVLDAEQPFRIASLTKVFVATAILRLREKELLSIEDPIATYISQEHNTILRKGGYNPDKITIRHCLTHSSGLYDYAEGGPEYIQEASKNSSKRWTRTEQIQFAMDNGKPHAAPGVEEHYSDTGYVLLGEIIEHLTKTGLAEGLRSLLKFDELGMSATYLESLEARPDGLKPSVKRYMGELDASDWDNSVDLYGGGGLAANTRDLGVFLQALFNGKIFEKDDTLSVMLLKKEYNNHGKALPDQRLGFGSIVGKESGLEVYMHTGFWGSVFIQIPAYNCSIAMNNTNDGDSNVLQRAVDYVKWLKKEKAD